MANNEAAAPADLAPAPAWRRIEPALDAKGNPVDQLPPCGGSWLRDADGGLTPRDEATARDAGLLNETPAAAESSASVQPE
jgi:hypothetical protein